MNSIKFLTLVLILLSSITSIMFLQQDEKQKEIFQKVQQQNKDLSFCQPEQRLASVLCGDEYQPVCVTVSAFLFLRFKFKGFECKNACQACKIPQYIAYKNGTCDSQSN